VRKAIVGYIVGFVVGKSDRPDMNRTSGMNNLDPNCRECRVPVTEERPGEFESLRPYGRT
jgi:hypothetical protein